MLAAANGKTDAARFLIDTHSADVNSASPPHPKGITPLLLAAQRGHIDVVQLLIEEHAELNRPMAGACFHA